jgi:hypothetical protein
MCRKALKESTAILSILLLIGCKEVNQKEETAEIMPSGFEYLKLGADKITVVKAAGELRKPRNSSWTPEQSSEEHVKDLEDPRFETLSLAFKAGRLMGVRFYIRECTQEMFEGITNAYNEKLGCTAKIRNDNDPHIPYQQKWAQWACNKGIQMRLVQVRDYADPCHHMVLVIYDEGAEQWIKTKTKIEI